MTGNSCENKRRAAHYVARLHSRDNSAQRLGVDIDARQIKILGCATGFYRREEGKTRPIDNRHIHPSVTHVSFLFSS